MSDKNEAIEEILDEKIARKLAVSFLTIIIIFLFVFITFYSSLRSRCIGIADGYIKAIETVYQFSENSITKDFPESNNFETGIYNVLITFKKSKSIEEPIILRIEIRDKFFNIKHYSKEVKFVPISNEI